MKLARSAQPATFDADRRRNEVAEKVNRLPFGGADARTVANVTFTAGQTQDVAHGLGRAAVGFIGVNGRTSAPLLYRSTSPDEVSFVRLTHSGGSTTLVDLVVW